MNTNTLTLWLVPLTIYNKDGSIWQQTTFYYDNENYAMSKLGLIERDSNLDYCYGMTTVKITIPLPESLWTVKAEPMTIDGSSLVKVEMQEAAQRKSTCNRNEVMATLIRHPNTFERPCLTDLNIHDFPPEQIIYINKTRPNSGMEVYECNNVKIIRGVVHATVLRYFDGNWERDGNYRKGGYKNGETITARITKCYLWGRKNERDPRICNWFTEDGFTL